MNDHTCSERIQTNVPEGPWGIESYQCGAPATRAYRWTNIGLAAIAYKCEEHGPALEERFRKEGLRYTRD